jgi:hypothetical protein
VSEPSWFAHQHPPTCCCSHRHCCGHCCCRCTQNDRLPTPSPAPPPPGSPPAGSFARLVATFCERMGWADMAALISKFQQRLMGGAREDVAALTRLDMIQGTPGGRCLLLLRTCLPCCAMAMHQLHPVLTASPAWAGPDPPPPPPGPHTPHTGSHVHAGASPAQVPGRGSCSRLGCARLMRWHVQVGGCCGQATAAEWRAFH